MASNDRKNGELASINAQLLLAEQVKTELNSRESESQKMIAKEIGELRGNLEKKDFLYQSADSRVRDLEQFIIELSESDDYVRSKL